MSAIRVAVLLSGSGTTLQNLLDRIADGRLRAQIVVVVSSKADAFGLDRAQRAGMPSAVIERFPRPSSSGSSARQPTSSAAASLTRFAPPVPSWSAWRASCNCCRFRTNSSAAC
jgi:folate-dependent phosphoribosylglycinamide formyltransferase PurN